MGLGVAVNVRSVCAARRTERSDLRDRFCRNSALQRHESPNLLHPHDDPNACSGLFANFHIISQTTYYRLVVVIGPERIRFRFLLDLICNTVYFYTPVKPCYSEIVGDKGFPI